MPSKYITMITNQIEPDLIPIAIVRFAAKNRDSEFLSALNACKATPEDECKLQDYVDRVFDFIKTYLDKVVTWTDLGVDFTPQVAHEFLEFHKTVSDFANMVIDHCIQVLPSLVPFTSVERQSVFRALYILELVRLLIPFKSHDLDKVHFMFWVYFPPWENKQVDCIFHSLCGLVEEGKFSP